MIGDYFNHACLHPLISLGCCDPETVRCDGTADVHGIVHKRRIISLFDPDCHFFMFCNDISINDGPRNANVIQIVEKDNISAFSGRNASHLVIHPETSCRIDRYILYGFNRIQSFPDRSADYMVHMAILCQRNRLDIVGDQACKAIVNLIVKDCVNDRRHFLPNASIAHQGIHAVPHFFEDVLSTYGFMAAPDTGCNIGIQPCPGIRHGIVPGDDLVCFQRVSKFAVHSGITVNNVLKTHHLSKSHNAVPGHHVLNFLRTDPGSGILESGNRGHTGRSVRDSLQRRAFRILDHGFNAFRTADIADLMRIHENAGCPVRDDRAGEFSDTDHGAFDMGMRIYKPRSDVLS